MSKVKLQFKDKEIRFLRVKEGDYKKKVWDKEQKKLVQTNDLHHWKVQTFSISLGKNGRENLGFANVEYWGDKTLVEGKFIQCGEFYLKQKKWDYKDPKTFVVKKMSEVILVMEDFDQLNEKSIQVKDYAKLSNATPEEAIQLAIEQYGKPVDIAEQKEESSEELVDINEEFKKMEL